MASKTPIMILQELCMKRKNGPPIYDLTADGSNDNTNNKLFEYQVAAFGHVASGQGKNKKEAKHEAAVNIITILRELPAFADDLSNVQAFVVPRTAMGTEGDAVSMLLDICVQRDWPIASFTVQQAFGTAHAPEFRVECRVASMVRVGTFSTKKGAKQIAAQEMLQVVQNLPQEECDQQVAKISDDLPEKHVKTYRELKKSDVKFMPGTKLCDRHKFFERLEDVEKEKWRTIMYDLNETPKEKVHLMCRALGWHGEVTHVSEHPDGNVKLFELQGSNYDMVMAGSEPQLYVDVLDFFQEMSGIRNVPGLYAC